MAKRAEESDRRAEEWDRRALEWDARVGRRLDEMAARQQYHDEAHERHDAKIKEIMAALAMDAENIRALARIAESHERRLGDIEGGEPGR